jgi:DNA polymerase III sliding clamp (beta) subunit (PCNA family)
MQRVKATAKRKPLADALAWVAQTTRLTTHIPILTCTHVRVDDSAQAVTLSTTDMDAWMSIDVPAIVPKGKGGTTAAGSYRLRDLVAAMRGDDVTVELVDGGLSIKSGRASYVIPTADPTDMPTPPAAGRTLLTIDADTLAEAWKRVAFAADPDSATESLRGVHLVIDPDRITLAASDSYIVSTVVLPLATEVAERTKLILPVRPVTDALKGLSDPVTLAYESGNGTIALGSPDREVQVRIYTPGRILDLGRVLGQVGGIPVEVETGDLIGAIKRAELGADDLGKGRKHVRIEAVDGEVSVTPVGGEVAGEDRADGLFAAPARGRYASQLLREGLAALDCKRVMLTLPEVDVERLPATLIAEAGVVDPAHRIVMMGVRES